MLSYSSQWPKGTELQNPGDLPEKQSLCNKTVFLFKYHDC